MPYKSIEDAKKAGFPTTAEGVPLTLAQINRLAHIYDRVKARGQAESPMAIAWIVWKKEYKKEGEHWVKMEAVELFDWQDVIQNPGSLKSESDAGLRLAHAVAHSWWKHKELRPDEITDADVKKFFEIVTAEMDRRKINWTELGAPVWSIRDRPLGRAVTLEEMLSYHSDIMIVKEGVVRYIGGLTNWGSTKGDLDVKIDMPKDTPESILHPIRFRVGRAIPPEISWRLQFRDPSNDELMGPFTNQEIVYDLALVPRHRFVEMELFAKELTLGSFVPVPKTSVGYHEGEVKEIEQVVARFKPDDYPISIEVKFDGLVIEWHKDGDDIVAFTDSGKRCEQRFPKIKKLLADHPCPELILMTETEGWDYSTTPPSHAGREEIAGYVNARTPPDDSNVVVNVWDVIWCKLPAGTTHHDIQPEGDIHEWPLEQRIRLRSLVAKLGKWQEVETEPKPGFNNVVSHIVEKLDVPVIKKQLETVRERPGSEGAMIKGMKDIFPLTGHIASWVKWKKSADLHVVVLKRNITRTAGVFNYFVGLLAKAGLPKVEEVTLKNQKKAPIMNVGKTSNIARKFESGDIITVLPHTLFHYADGHVMIYESPIYEARPDQVLPDTVEDAIKVAKSQAIYREKAKASVFEKPLRFAFQLHFIGKAVGGDLRLEETPGGTLEGWSIAVEKKGEIKEPVETVEKARSIERNWNQYLKPIDEPGFQLLVVGRKAKQDNIWMKINNRVDEPGGMISSKNEKGVMIITDSGTYEPGSQKAYYKEYFLHGKKLKGRHVVRMLHLRGETVWMIWKTKDEEPFVVSSRAVREEFLPGEGSGLPKELETKVPKELQWWTPDLSRQDRLARRKEYRKQWLKQFAKARWLLQYQWWRGQLVKRRGPSREIYILRAILEDKVYYVEMTQDPREKKVGGRIEETKYDEFWDVKDQTLFIPPKTTYNPTKNTPSFLMTLDSGALDVLQDEPLVKKFKLGPKLLFFSSRTEPTSDIWEVYIGAE